MLVFPSFVNDSALLVFQAKQIRLLDISDRGNIIQSAQWTFDNYLNTSTIYDVQVLNSSCAFVLIANDSMPLDLLLIDILNTAQVSILKSVRLNSPRRPSVGLGGPVTCYTSTHAYWVTDVEIVSLDFATWTVILSNWPQPYNNRLAFTLITGLTSFQNGTKLMLAVSSGFESIFLDITSISNISLVDVTTSTSFGTEMHNKTFNS